MQFNSFKCHVLTVNKRSSHCHPYFCELCGSVLTSVDSEKYDVPWVPVSNDLSWSSHVNMICTKASQKLGFIKANSPQELKRLAYITRTFAKNVRITSIERSQNVIAECLKNVPRTFAYNVLWTFYGRFPNVWITLSGRSPILFREHS